jgi:hypothetical protein
VYKEMGTVFQAESETGVGFCQENKGKKALMIWIR